MIVIFLLFLCFIWIFYLQIKILKKIESSFKIPIRSDDVRVKKSSKQMNQTVQLKSKMARNQSNDGSMTSGIHSAW